LSLGGRILPSHQVLAALAKRMHRLPQSLQSPLFKVRSTFLPRLLASPGAPLKSLRRFRFPDPDSYPDSKRTNITPTIKETMAGTSNRCVNPQERGLEEDGLEERRCLRKAVSYPSLPPAPAASLTLALINFLRALISAWAAQALPRTAASSTFRTLLRCHIHPFGAASSELGTCVPYYSPDARTSVKAIRQREKRHTSGYRESFMDSPDPLK